MQGRGNKSPDGLTGVAEQNSRQTALCTFGSKQVCEAGARHGWAAFQRPSFVSTGWPSWTQGGLLEVRYQSGHFEVEWNKGKHPN